jgi:hypothetical protein
VKQGSYDLFSYWVLYYLGAIREGRAGVRRELPYIWQGIQNKNVTSIQIDGINKY